MKEKKLLLGFGAFLILTLAIGAIGIIQIYSLTKTVQELGASLLPREMTILEMKTNNALYAMGVRNYTFWRTSKYLEAASIASDLSLVEKSLNTFRHHLAMYESMANYEEQKKWISQLKGSIKELEGMGSRLISLVNSEAQDKDNINKLLMVFENKSYRIDDFLAETLSKNNLKGIENQLLLANIKKQASILVLSLSLLLSIILGMTITYIVYKNLEEERRRRELLVQKMIRLEEEERRNLSGQVHDQLSQDLSALKIFLELIGKGILPEQAEQKERINKCSLILADLVDKGHNISELLRPPELDEMGLIESISSLVAEHKEITGNNYNYYRPASEVRLPPESSLVLYRVVQEALTNIANYAKAKNVEVALESNGGMIKLSVTDDGIGFDYQEFLKHFKRRKEDRLRLGLQGLRERVELLDGSMRIESSVGKGTRIIVELPVR